MQEIYQECIDEQNHSTLSQLLLRFQFILQLKNSLSQDDYQQVITNIDYEILSRKQPIVLQQGTVYLFLDRGAIYRKECNGKSQIVFKNNTSSRMQKQPNQSKQPPKAIIKQYDSYEPSANMSKYLQDLYYTQNNKNSTVILLNLNSIKPSTFSKIKQINISKMKLIHEGQEMRSIQRMILLQRLHKFQYIQLQFGQALYSQFLRHQYVFFVKSGLIEVICGRKKSSGYVVNAKSSVGWLKDKQEWARCTSQRVQCYAIKIQELVSYFPNICQNYGQFDKRNRIYHQLTAVQTPMSSGVQSPQAAYAPIISEYQNSNQPINRGTISSRRRFVHKSMQNLKLGEKKQSKRLALKQHFSNYYNQIFDQFSQKKMKQMGTTYQNQQNLNLYKIKVLQRKAPAMQQLKNRLRKMRIQKINACKQKLSKKVHVYSLSGLGVTILEEQL